MLATFTTTRTGREIRVTSSGSVPGWKVQLSGIGGVSAEGGSVTPDPLGVIVRAEAGTVVLTLDA